LHLRRSREQSFPVGTRAGLRLMGVLIALIAVATGILAASTTARTSAADTGFENPTAEIADAGDGFEVTPANAFLDDAAVATNVDGSGHSHRYFNYGFGVPAGATVDGIEVRLDWYLDDLAGVSSMAVELSPDAGVTWTALNVDAVESVAEHTTVLGGPADLWGRTWSPGDLLDANFRLRVSAASDDTARDFNLDWVSVRVFFTPAPTATPTPTETPTSTSTPTATPTAMATVRAGTYEQVVPTIQITFVGQSVTTDITVNNVTNLGAYEVIITYDSSLVQFVSATDAGFLGSSGRTLFCPAPVILDLGGATRQLRFGCATTGAVPGPSGSGILAQITWTAMAAGTALLDLEPSLADPLGDSIFATAIDGEIVVATGPTFTPTPTNTPCPGGICPTATPTNTPTSTPTPTNTPTIACGVATAVVCIQPLTGTIPKGTAFGVTVAAANVTGIGAFEFTLSYDAALMTAANVSLGPMLGSTGRTVQCLSPTFTPGSVQWTCVTLGSSPGGVSGSGILATISFAAENEGTTALDLHDVTLTDIVGGVLATVAVDGSRTVGPCVGVCPTATATPTNTATPTPTNTPTPTSTPTPCVGECPTNTPTATPTETFIPLPTNTSMPVLQTIMRVTPPSQNVVQTGSAVVDVVLENVANLGAYEVGVTYDESILSFVSVTNGPFLGSTGRTVQCPSFSAGSGFVVFACFTLGSEPGGATGSGILARFVFSGDQPGTSALTLNAPIVTTTSGATVSFTTAAGNLTVDPCPGVCPTATPTPTPGTPTATPTPAGQVSLGSTPAAVAVQVGGEFVIDITVSGAANVGSYEVLLQYAFNDLGGFSPGVLNFVSFTNGPFLGSTGRAVTCVEPVIEALGVRIGCVTTGPNPPGPSGGGLLAQVRLKALSLSIRPMVVAVDPTTGGLSDPLGTAIPFVALGSTTVTISPTVTTNPFTLPGAAAGSIAAAPTRGEPMATGNASQRAIVASWNSIAPDTDQSGTAESGGDSRISSTIADAAPALVIAMLIVGSCLLAALFVPQLPAQLAQPRFLVSVGALVIAAQFVLSPAWVAQAANPIAVFKSPSSANLFLGGPPLVIEEEVAMVDAPGLGSFELEVQYNASVLDIAIEEGPFLASTGNSTACTTGFPGIGKIRFSCTVVGQPPSGAVGRGVLARLRITPDDSLPLRPTNNNGILTALDDVKATTFVRDVDGVSQQIVTVGDAIVVVRALEGDLNRDCRVNVIDDQMIAVRYNAVFGSLLYDPYFDLEPALADQDIDIKDLQFVFGRNGSTCTVPVPSQTPPPGVTPTIPPTSTSTPIRTSTPQTTTPVVSTATPQTTTPVVSTATPQTTTPVVSTAIPVTPRPTGTATRPSPTPTRTLVSTVVAGGAPTKTPVVPSQLPSTGGHGGITGGNARVMASAFVLAVALMVFVISRALKKRAD